jgi:hypothetical protein
MDRTTIMLPNDLKIRASNEANKRHMSLGQFIREALKKSLNSSDGNASASDPFLCDNVAFNDEIPEDLSIDHDKYLYGDAK